MKGEPSVLILSRLSTGFTALNSAQRGSFQNHLCICKVKTETQMAMNWRWEILSNLSWLTRESERKRENMTEMQRCKIDTLSEMWGSVRVQRRGTEKAVARFRLSEGRGRTIKLTRGSKLICIQALTLTQAFIYVFMCSVDCVMIATSPLTLSLFTPTLVPAQVFQAWTWITLSPQNMLQVHNISVNIS